MAGGITISKRLVLINSSSSLVANLINVGVLVWLQQYLIRHIAPEEYAIYPLLMAVLLFVPLLSTLMIGGVGRFATEAYARRDLRRVTEIISTVFLPLVGVAVLLLLGGGAFAMHVDHFIDLQPSLVDDARLMMLLLVASAAIRLVSAPFSIGLFVRQRFVTINIIAVATQILRLTLLLMLLLGFGPRVLWVVVATVGANMLQVSVTLFLSRRAIPALRFDRKLINYRTIGHVATFNAWIFFSHLSNMLKQAADPWILHHFASDVDVWCMNIGSMAYDRVDSSSVVATQTAQPALTALHATGDKERLGLAYLRGSRYALWLACAVAIPVIIYAQDLMMLYLGDKFAEFSAIVPVIILIFLLFPIWYPTLLLSRITEATAKVKLFSIYAVLMNLLNLALSLYFVIVLHYGAVGAASARVVASLVAWPFIVHLGLTLTGVRLRRWLFETVWLGLAPSAVGAAIWVTMRRGVEPDSWMHLALCVAVGAVAYLATLAWCLRPDERHDLRRLLAALGLLSAPPDPSSASADAEPATGAAPPPVPHIHTRPTPRVTIGLPVYNGENYLRAAIESLQAQTYPDFELLISDNASTDATPDICAEVARADDRIRILRQPENIGAAPNFNAIVPLARGELFRWHAHDDLCMPEHLECCVRTLDQERDVVLAYPQTLIISATGERQKLDPFILLADDPRPAERFREILRGHGCYEVFGLMRTATLRQTRLIGNFAHGDGVLLAELALRGRFCEIQAPLFLSRNHAEHSMSMVLNYHAYAAWFDPKNAGKLVFPCWRILREYLRAVNNAPISASQRMRCYRVLASWCVEWRRRLRGDLSFAVRRLAGIRQPVAPERRPTISARPDTDSCS